MCHSCGDARKRQSREGRPCAGPVGVVHLYPYSSFHTFQNPKRRVLPSNSSVSSVAGWTLPTSSSVPSASVPWHVRRGEWPQPLPVSTPSPSSGLQHLVSCLPLAVSRPSWESLHGASLRSYFLHLPGSDTGSLTHQVLEPRA